MTARRQQIDNLSTRLASLARLQQTLVNNNNIDQDALNSIVNSLRAIAQLGQPKLKPVRFNRTLAQDKRSTAVNK